MDYVMQGLYDYGNILIYLLLGFSFLFNILSLRKIRFLRTNIEQLVERIKIIENQGLSEQVDTMIDKIDSMSKGTRKLPERVQAVEFDVQMLPQSFDKVTDRMNLQNGNQKTDTLVKLLETRVGQEIQDLRETMIKRLEMIEETIGAGEQSKKAQGQDTMPPPAVRTGLPRVLTTYPVIYSDKGLTSKGSKGVKEARWTPIAMNDLKEIKQAVVNFGLHSAFVKEMIRTWASNVRATPHDFSQLVSAVLDDGPSLMFGIYFREESKHMEQQGRAKGVEVSQDQILGVGAYADPQVQALYDEEVLSLCHKAALNALNRIQDPAKRVESYTRVRQGQREPFTDFVQRLIKALDIGVTDPEARRILLESLAFENANTECKKIIGPLRSRSAPMEEWIQHTMNVEMFSYNDESWVGEAISKAMRRHQTTRCFNCGKLGHLKRDCRQRNPRNNISSGNDKSRRSQPSGICRRCGKGRHWSNECRSTTDRQGNPIPSGNSLRGLSQAPKPKVAQSFPVTVENVSHQEN